MISQVGRLMHDLQDWDYNRADSKHWFLLLTVALHSFSKLKAEILNKLLLVVTVDIEE